ncbi:hypothetical protein AB837_00549 [bacterium AB1]|nr:hypothetical protein AB837_00549 [bacterium AB1]
MVKQNLIDNIIEHAQQLLSCSKTMFFNYGDLDDIDSEEENMYQMGLVIKNPFDPNECHELLKGCFTFEEFEQFDQIFLLLHSSITELVQITENLNKPVGEIVVNYSTRYINIDGTVIICNASNIDNRVNLLEDDLINEYITKKNEKNIICLQKCLQYTQEALSQSLNSDSVEDLYIIIQKFNEDIKYTKLIEYSMHCFEPLKELIHHIIHD